MVMAVFLLLFLLLCARLFELQVVEAANLMQQAQKQWTSESTLAPQRGAILDRNGVQLAVSATAYIASVSPRQVADVNAFAATLSPVLDIEEATIRKKASDTSKGGVTLKRQIPRDTAQQLRTMYAEHLSAGSDALKGLYLEEDSRRYYPMGAFASQLLGITSIDGVGQSGLESTLNSYLSGKSGKVLDEVDGKGRAISSGAQAYIPAVNGGEVVLTIDYTIQSFVEQAAREAMELNNAQGVRCIVMSPKTGEILAACVKPDFDLNDPPRYDVALLNELMRNRLVTDAYEPGSTFKIITTAIALETGVTNVNEGFYCSGSITIDGSRVSCWGKPHGALSMAQALYNSCNPVFVELGLRIGVDRYYDYLDAFGFGSPTGVGIAGEASGILIAERNVKRVDMARIGFGQSVAVTPIQLITACCSAVNGGNLMKPYIVSEIRDSSGDVIEVHEPEVVGTTITAETSKTLRKMLEGVVEEGGGRNAYIEGYRIGGKTGTAQVYKNGVVSSDTHIGSFIGFAPIDDPEIAILFIVDEADKAIDFGSVTAAPFARDILEKTLAYLGHTPATQSGAAADVEVPNIVGLTLKEAGKRLKEAGLQYEYCGDGGQVTDQLPVSGAQMPEKSIVMIYTEGKIYDNASVVVPDITGMSVAQADALLQSYGFALRANGTGVAVSQSPNAGESAIPTTVITAQFEMPSSGTQ